MLKRALAYPRPLSLPLCVLLFMVPGALECFAQAVRQRDLEPKGLHRGEVERRRMILERPELRIPHRALSPFVSPQLRQHSKIHLFNENGAQSDSASDGAHSDSVSDQPPLDLASVGYPNFDLPTTVEINQPFKIDVWITPVDKNVAGSAKIYMEQTDSVAYEPRVFTLKLGERKTIQARVLKSRAGLAQIIATGDDWGPMAATVDAGFQPILRSNLPDAVEGGSEGAFNLSFVDSHAKPVALDAPVRLALRISNAEMRLAPTDAWTEAIDLQVEPGASSSPLVNIMCPSYLRKAAFLTAAVKMNGDYTILNDTFRLEILPRWWVALLMSIFGGVLHWSYETTKRWLKAGGKSEQKQKFLARFVVASISGAVGYFLASTNVVGIKLDTTSLRAFVILGFLLSYVGVDLVLKRGLHGTSEHSPQSASRSSHVDALS